MIGEAAAFADKAHKGAFRKGTAVSYTHLDVYKRQDYPACRPGRGLSEDIRGSQCYVYCLRIDVDKRQGLYHDGFHPHPGPAVPRIQLPQQPFHYTSGAGKQPVQRYGVPAGRGSSGSGALCAGPSNHVCRSRFKPEPAYHPGGGRFPAHSGNPDT